MQHTFATERRACQGRASVTDILHDIPVGSDLSLAIKLAVDSGHDSDSSVTEDETESSCKPSDASEQSAYDSDSDGQGEVAPLLSEKPVIARKQRLDEVR